MCQRHPADFFSANEPALTFVLVSPPSGFLKTVCVDLDHSGGHRLALLSRLKAAANWWQQANKNNLVEGFQV